MSSFPTGPYRSIRPLRTHSVRRARCRSYSTPSEAAAESSGAAAKRSAAERRTVFSGIQPTGEQLGNTALGIAQPIDILFSGIPHLGNYLGAIQTWQRLQSHPPSPDSTTLFSIVGLHAITMPQPPAQLRRERRDCLACLLACGLGAGRGSTLFFQEDVREHAELAWVLNTLVGVGKLQRMTTWKSKLAIAKAEKGEVEAEDTSMGDLKLGLFAYPVLQAADILLYKSTDIPVGEDQQQHLELSRDIAETFNSRFGRTFPLPQHMITPSKRVLSLTDPSQKMSKSAPNAASRILITDSPAVIARKIKGAVTDAERSITYDPETRRGVANLLTILAACESGHDAVASRSAEEVAQAMRDEGISGHAALKSRVTDAVVSRLAGIREEFERIRADENYLSDIARQGADEARTIAQRTMREVRRKVGLDSI